MSTTPSRRPPLKTEDVRRLLVSIDALLAELPHDLSDHPSALDGYVEVAAAVGHELPQQVTEPTNTCTVCNNKFTHEPIHGEFCSTECEDWAFDHPDKPPYAPKGGKGNPKITA